MFTTACLLLSTTQFEVIAFYPPACFDADHSFDGLHDAALEKLSVQRVLRGARWETNSVLEHAAKSAESAKSNGNGLCENRYTRRQAVTTAWFAFPFRFPCRHWSRPRYEDNILHLGLRGSLPNVLLIRSTIALFSSDVFDQPFAFHSSPNMHAPQETHSRMVPDIIVGEGLGLMYPSHPCKPIVLAFVTYGTWYRHVTTYRSGETACSHSVS